jgi:hypothetical protein
MLRVGSLFGQILHQVPREEFERLVVKHRAERYAKGFSSWTQLVAMLFSQLAHADSLREICNGLACCLGKLSHVGVPSAPCRSTLSYANAHRPAALFEETFFRTLGRLRHSGLLGRRKPFRFKNKLLSLDATTISLCLSLFPWAEYQRTKGGVKLHVLLSHDDYLPEYVLITEARRNDVRAAREVPLQEGSLVVLDRGYIDFKLLERWHQAGIFWVVRVKENLSLLRWEIRPAVLGPVLCDEEVIRGVEIASNHRFPGMLRLVSVWDVKSEQTLELLTNHPRLSASTIARIYRERWQIELFFKALKQNLKVKTFVGTSPNALKIQIWTALLALLLLKWLHYLSQAGWSLSNLAHMLRLNLFTYRDLPSWLKNPTETPPLIPDPEQLALPLAGFGQHVSRIPEA